MSKNSTFFSVRNLTKNPVRYWLTGFNYYNL